ncbi:26157_t:CDS:2, partial [Dentiscutata erythropus]
MLNFYQIFKLTIFGHVNDSIQSLTVEEGNTENKYVFPLAEGQGKQNTNDIYVINPIIKSFKVRLLILKQDNTCQLTQDEGIGQNASLSSSAVFENLSNLINSRVKRNFNIVYEKIQNIEYKRYFLGPKFNPTRDKGFLRGPCAVILDFIQTYRFIDLGTNNALAIRNM